MERRKAVFKSSVTPEKAKMARASSFQMPNMGRVLSIISVILQFILFFFVLVATPLEMFSIYHSSIMGGTCITLWGTRPCSAAAYSSRHFRCNSERAGMGTGAAFAIISILVTLGAFVALLMKVMRGGHLLMSKILCIVSIVTILCAWASAATVYNERLCAPYIGLNSSYAEMGYVYGAGFGLLMTAWVVQILVTILCFIF